MNDRGGAALTPLARVLAGDPHLAEMLLYAARRHARNAADAEDLFQETIALALSRSDPPDPQDLPAVRAFFGSVMNGCGANRRRAARRHMAVEYEEEGGPRTPAADPSPERALIEREEESERRRLKAALRELLEGEATALALFDWAEAGERDSAALAKRIGCSVQEIYGAQRRIAYHARKLKEQMVASERRAS